MIRFKSKKPVDETHLKVKHDAASENFHPSAETGALQIGGHSASALTLWRLEAMEASWKQWKPWIVWGSQWLSLSFARPCIWDLLAIIFPPLGEVNVVIPSWG